MGASDKQSSPDSLIDFAILTAIDLERQAVCAAFGLTNEHRVRKEGSTYWRGTLPLKDGQHYGILVAQQRDMGQVEAALLATDVIKHWQPSAALLVGIGTTTKPDEVKLGDVVVGRSVYYYEHGKVTAEGTKLQPEIIPADASLLAHFVGSADWDGAVPVERPDDPEGKPKIHYGVIASGEKVIASAAARDAIASGHRKIIALSMESYGFSRVFSLSFERVRYLEIRGICDDGSERKDDRWRRYAAAASASFARHFMLNRPVEPKGR
ncbi:hypothetical protein BE20_18855 [Sorangium cellulosum]|uniref:Nucleoside phosphorylase domain-containing protein n=1 Tax=Sorangium cellulosum TaxID=56 RepID=A0A150SCE5_SORCE|nr:hypothetical protein BE18_45330 [Sorangium cellulosum]KYF90060.1 hypothetical protein BE20_18855 [Sorangium cellulosum]